MLVDTSLGKKIQGGKDRKHNANRVHRSHREHSILAGCFRPLNYQIWLIIESGATLPT